MGHFREVLHNTALTSTEEMKTKHNDSKKAEYSKAILHSRFHSRCHIFFMNSTKNCSCLTSNWYRHLANISLRLILPN